MFRVLIYSAFFVHLSHFGVSAQTERVNLTSKKDSLSFALGVESAAGLFKEDSKFEAMDKVLLVKGFQSSLSNSSVDDCHSTIENFLGPQGQDFHKTYLIEGSTCIGRMCGFYFYAQMDQMGQLPNIDLAIVKRGFKQGVFHEDYKNLSAKVRAQIIKEFGEKLQAEFDSEVEAKDKIFWEEVLSKPGVEQIGETGIYFETIEKGTGGKPTMDSDFEAHYILTNAEGDTLESSYANDQSLKMNLSQVIEGWRKGFPALNKGGKYRLFVPWEKAYKNGNAQAPQGALCFFVEFIDFGPEGSLTKARNRTRIEREY